MKTTFLLTFFLSTVAFAQNFQSAILNYSNGQKKEGFVNVKSLSPKDFKFKANESGDTQKIISSDLESIVFKSDNSEDIQFDFINYKNGKKTSNNWMLKLASGYYDLYTSGGGSYSFDKKGNLVLRRKSYVGQINTAAAVNLTQDEYFYVKKRDEKIAELIGIQTPVKFSAGYQSVLKKQVAKLMADNPALVADVNSKKYKPKDIEQIVFIYNNSKK